MTTDNIVSLNTSNDAVEKDNQQIIEVIFNLISTLREVLKDDDDDLDDEAPAEIITEEDKHLNTTASLKAVRDLLSKTVDEVQYKVTDLSETLSCLRDSVKRERKARMKMQKEHRRTSVKCSNAMSSIHELHDRIQFLDCELKSESRRHSKSAKQLKEVTKAAVMNNYEKQMLAVDMKRAQLKLHATRSQLRNHNKSTSVRVRAAVTRRKSLDYSPASSVSSHDSSEANNGSTTSRSSMESASMEFRNVAFSLSRSVSDLVEGSTKSKFMGLIMPSYTEETLGGIDVSTSPVGILVAA